MLDKDVVTLTLILCVQQGRCKPKKRDHIEYTPSVKIHLIYLYIVFG